MIEQITAIFGQVGTFLGGFGNIFKGLKDVIETIVKWTGAAK
ncbi:PorACj family cell wall channel-forming small protein [Corynebacterium sp. c9Ua_112]|uniref:PorACj family cell wall channel-forming small protein n=1 Tax=Corynebacterium macclintockiae TaxID=2913501 RepID=A0A9X3M772_9CORY|nr:PorACj family cell wall channel-forming small protein [Corynebacterium macclintockiae]MCZ9304928.1 PorACj family cell wall channel-forming small protein [Corynebacterium macclintockiae]